MNKAKAAVFGAICVGTWLVASVAQATEVRFSSLAAAWVDVNPDTVSVMGNGTNVATLSWGVPKTMGDAPSSYVFETVSTPSSVLLPPSPSDPFELGTWTHQNTPILLSNDILQSATLRLDAAISVDGVDVGSRHFFFDFTHEEANNSDDPCLNGAPNGVGNNQNGCADRVTINYNTRSDSFAVNGVTYTITVSGSSSRMETVESQLNSFVILGMLQKSALVVSEPGMFVLLSLGLLSLGLRGLGLRDLSGRFRRG
ncbi:MAG: THxN family PEP-CTERM protein [Gammaproteobacteria bacterium]